MRMIYRLAAALIAVLFVVSAALAQSDGMMPTPPIFGEEGENILEVANAALAEVGPKGPVFPRVIHGGQYSEDSGREEFETALMNGAPTSMGVNNDFWSVFSYDGREDDSCAWFYPLTQETENPTLLSKGVFEEVVYIGGKTSTITSPVVRLDTMAAVCLVQLDNMGARGLTKNAGILSFVLVDGQTKGHVTVALAVPPQFTSNFTGGNPEVVPAVIINGQPGKPVLLTYVDGAGEIVNELMAKIEKVNGTLTVQVPNDGGYVILDIAVSGSSKNANTELLMRLGSQPLSDTEGKNWVPMNAEEVTGDMSDEP